MPKFFIANIELSIDDESISKQLLICAESFSDAAVKLCEHNPSIYKVSIEAIGDGIMDGLPYIHLPEDKAFIEKLHEENTMQY